MSATLIDPHTQTTSNDSLSQEDFAPVAGQPHGTTPATTARGALNFPITLLAVSAVLGLAMLVIPSVGLAAMAALALVGAGIAGPFAAFRNCL